jgi:LysR family transcriptional activator of nhaA
MINYKHLYYFWVVASEGGVVNASKRLHLTPQTISGQLSLLEQQMGKSLFTRTGRRLKLTDHGHMAMRYADEIFSLGNEMEQKIRYAPEEKNIIFKVGIADVVPKSIAYRLLSPAYSLNKPIRLICRENNLKQLLADLAIHKLDLVLADGPVPPGINVRGFNHPLGESGVTFFASQSLFEQLSGDFPQCLALQPLLLPGDNTMIYTQLMEWLEKKKITPIIVGEFDDSALMKVFGQAGIGIFIAPTAIAQEVQQQYDVVPIGSTDEIKKKYYAISVERKISHPAVVKVTESAKEWLTISY